MNLTRAASLEMSVLDIPALTGCRALIPDGTKMYVSHLPGQAWAATLSACIAARAAGCDVVPHVPVRCIVDRMSLVRFLKNCVAEANVRDALVVAGDYPISAGPYATTMDVLRSGILEECGLRRISVAGHPEGHPKIEEAELRRAESEKIHFALDRGVQLTFLTQFFFEADPFIDWRRRLPIDDRVRVVAGLAGPATLSTLLRFALKCGVGPSLRALGARPGSLLQLLGDRGPESLVLAIARLPDDIKCGMHLFSFGGLARTCAWLQAVRAGRFKLDDNGSFTLRDRE
jgi:methylenetetrahydrofolate reductase (NADPH)